MKRKGKLFIFIIIAAFLSTACSKDPVVENPEDGIYAIRSIYGYGKTNAKFLYNSLGEIAEYQSFYFCYRYIYDENGRLIKEENVAASDLYSSGSEERSELMTSQNSTFTGYSLYEYNPDGI